MFEPFIAEVSSVLPDVPAQVSQSYLEEPRGLVSGVAGGLLKPRTTADVSKIVALANSHGVPLIPYAGGTGLVGGQVQGDDDRAVVLSLERMTEIDEVDPFDRSLRAGAGAVLADIHTAARKEGMLFPLSLASEGSCRIGGNLATNAGGVQVLRYGTARDLCLGIEAVLPDGQIISTMAPLRKDNTGYDIRNLLIGSEGTLGIITAARLKLHPTPTDIVTALFQVPSPDASLSLLQTVQRRLGDIVSAFELIHRTGIDFLVETMPELALPPTGAGEWLVLVEVGGWAGDAVRQDFEATLAEALEAGLVTDGHIAQSEAQRNAIWGLREAIPEGNRRVGSVASHDISVPVARLPDFVRAGFRRIAEIDPHFRVNAFGHVGDGNLHYNVFPPHGRPKSEYRHLSDEVRGAVHQLTHDFGGSISAEHGIGRLKRADLARFGDPGKLAAMRAIKTALDPNGIMNPGVLLD